MEESQSGEAAQQAGDKEGDGGAAFQFTWTPPPPKKPLTLEQAPLALRSVSFAYIYSFISYLSIHYYLLFIGLFFNECDVVKFLRNRI